jgi:hypothetical protein
MVELTVVGGQRVTERQVTEFARQLHQALTYRL